MKRDDVQGVALAGNKIRKFNLVLGRALADGADTLVTTGALQSNSARTGAVAAAAVGMECHLVLSGIEPLEHQANLLIDHLVDATIHYAGGASWDDLNRQVNDLVAELNASGRRAVAAPVGCSSPLGSLGFALALLELEAQVVATGLLPSALVHTTTSGGTHAGLLVGRALAGPLADLPVIGVDAGRLYPDTATFYKRLAVDAAAVLDLDLDLDLKPDHIRIVDQTGDGYGHPTAEAAEAIRLLARTEGILVDPVYSGKGLAGLIALLQSGEIAGPVVFWHTGGYHALFDTHYGAPLVRPVDPG